jgi:hypothetical protein
MDRVTRCLRCGKRMVFAPSCSGRTELKCVFCDKLDPMEAPAPLAQRISEKAPFDRRSRTSLARGVRHHRRNRIMLQGEVRSEGWRVHLAVRFNWPLEKNRVHVADAR